MIHFTVPIAGVPKGRPVFGNGRARTPAKTRAFEQALQGLSRPHRPPEPWLGPLDVALNFFFERPRRSKLRFPHYDVDNLAKAVLDSFNELFWEDDRQVVQLTASKRFAEKAYIEVIICHHPEPFHETAKYLRKKAT